MQRNQRTGRRTAFCENTFLEFKLIFNCNIITSQRQFLTKIATFCNNHIIK